MESKKSRCIFLSDKVWEIAKEKAQNDNRSISNWLTILILKESTKQKN